MHGDRIRYQAPVVRDYGDLLAVTAAIHPQLGVGAPHDLSFSAAPGGQTAGNNGGGLINAPVAGGNGAAPSAQGLHATPTGGVSGVTHVPSGPGGSGAAGGGGAGGAAGAGGAGGGTLPFTGFVVGIPAALGGAMTAAGMALRRALRRRTG